MKEVAGALVTALTIYRCSRCRLLAFWEVLHRSGVRRWYCDECLPTKYRKG